MADEVEAKKSLLTAASKSKKSILNGVNFMAEVCILLFRKLKLVDSYADLISGRILSRQNYNNTIGFIGVFYFLSSLLL